jgi:hypothetical protein
MACKQFFDLFGLVVNAEAVNDGGAGFVHADELDLRAFAAEFEHHLVQRGDGADVP